MKIVTKWVWIVLAVVLCSSCGYGYTPKKVHETTGTLPVLPIIDVTDPYRFLNDLMLSPFWKVEKTRYGTFMAKARSTRQKWPADQPETFLFEFMTNSNGALPADCHIQNDYLNGNGRFSSYQISVLFHKPNPARSIMGVSGEPVTIPVYESYEKKIGLNSSSDLAIKLSSQHDIYVILKEQGADPERKTTFAKLLPAMQALADIANAPETYRTEERYAAFFHMLFPPPLKEDEIKRFIGMQDRDTFYGYFRTKPATSYSGVNIKVSHPVYCPIEGTRKHSRLQKAEYLGTPYQERDLVFYLIEDNAIYLSGDYDQRFGTFTGTESFEGDIEIFNKKEKLLLKSKGPFKGWQR